MKFKGKSYFPLLEKQRIQIFLMALLVTLLSTLFRLGPLDFVAVADEQYIVNNLENFYRTESLEPIHFINPPLTHYFCWVVQTVTLKLKAEKPLYEAYAYNHFNDDRSIYRVCRLVHLILAIGIAPFLFFLSLKLYKSKGIAFLACFLVSISFWHASRSRFALIDVPIALFLTVSFGFLLLWINEKKLRFLYIGAFFGGVATAVKLSGAALIFPLLACLWWTTEPEDIMKNPKTIWFVILFLTITSAALILLDFSGLWKIQILKFSLDGKIHPVSIAYFGKIVDRFSFLGMLIGIIAGLLVWRFLKFRSFQPKQPNRLFLYAPI